MCIFATDKDRIDVNAKQSGGVMAFGNLRRRLLVYGSEEGEGRMIACQKCGSTRRLETDSVANNVFCIMD